MDRDTVLAVEYLRGPIDTRGIGRLWRWADGERVVTWPHGTTIAFREELAQVLEPLVSRGLPPLLSVLVLLSATHSNWPAECKKLFGPSGLLFKSRRYIDQQPIGFPPEDLEDL